MSKTNATGIHPFELLDHFGVDAYRYYFLREIRFGAGRQLLAGSRWSTRYNADLANGLGNLASRVLAMVESYFGGQVPERAGRRRPSRARRRRRRGSPSGSTRRSWTVRLTDAVAALWDFVREANRYLVEAAPWALAKDPARRDELGDDPVRLAGGPSAHRAVLLRGDAVRRPSACGRSWASPSRSPRSGCPEAAAWGGLAAGTRTHEGEALFPRLDD